MAWSEDLHPTLSNAQVSLHIFLPEDEKYPIPDLSFFFKTLNDGRVEKLGSSISDIPYHYQNPINYNSAFIIYLYNKAAFLNNIYIPTSALILFLL